jgi:putative peptidoglycan lipid II flippase
MLRVFAPQLPLYGAGIVLTGVLQAHHRFAWPVIAPLLSSVTVMGAYQTYAR